MNIRILAAIAGLAAVTLFMANAEAADSAPAKPVGVTGMNDAVGSVDLAPHKLTGALADYDLRSRLIAIAPGGAVHEHAHAGRPGIVLVTKGNVIEYRGAKSRSLRPGDSWQEDADTVHWFRNPSLSEVAEIWAVDLVPKKK